MESPSPNQITNLCQDAHLVVSPTLLLSLLQYHIALVKCYLIKMTTCLEDAQALKSDAGQPNA
jgi:hypothetical protein